jgi:phosphopantetheinyl transferase
MNSKFYYSWPNLPNAPEYGKFIVVRCDYNINRRSDKHKISRDIIVQVLGLWTNSHSNTILLQETKNGPKWNGSYKGNSIFLSISHSNSTIWIAFSHAINIGIDATTIIDFPERNNVSKLYFDEYTYSVIKESPQPDYEFAKAWTSLEAQLKLRKLGLIEYSSNYQLEIDSKKVNFNHFFEENQFVTIAT